MHQEELIIVARVLGGLVIGVIEFRISPTGD